MRSALPLLLPTAFSGDVPYCDPEDGKPGATVLEQQPAPDDQHAELERREVVESVRNLVRGALTRREANVLMRRMSGEEILEDIAASWGVTRERTRQIQEDALYKLRRALGLVEKRERHARRSTRCAEKARRVMPWE